MFKEKWAIFELKITDLEAAKRNVTIICPNPLLGQVGEDHVSFEIPTYQRGLVWTAKHGEQFQQSLKSGWPIGQLVLAEKRTKQAPGDRVQREYQLIDGQQRTFWLNRTRERFFIDKHYSLEEIRLAKPLGSIGMALGVEPALVTESIQRWTSRDAFSPSHLRDARFLMLHLFSDLDVLPLMDDDPRYAPCSEALVMVNVALENQFRALKEYGIPVLLIRQELQDDLHEIFQRLNEGTSLSDLDLLAAEWRFFKVDIANSELKSSIKSQLIKIAQNRILGTYDQDSYEYDPDLVELKPEDMSLFDLLYSLGRYAVKKYPDTFGALVDTGNVSAGPSDRLAIFVAALVFGGGIGKRKDLRESYPDAMNAPGVDATLFPRFFLDACHDIDGAFTALNGVKSGKRLRGRLGLIQAATYIATYIGLVGYVDRGAKNRLALSIRTTNNMTRLTSIPTEVWSVAKRRDTFKRHLVGWFLIDSLSEVFQGSDAYSSAAQRVWSEFDMTDKLIANESMLSAVPHELLGSELGARFTRELEVPVTPKQRRYSEPGCVVLRVAYASLNQVISGEEIDHVIPFDARNGLNFPVAINHVANLMPIRKVLNTSRRERFIPDYFRDPNITNDVKAEMKARLLVSEDEVSSSVLDSQDSFREMLAARWLKLVRLALASVDHPALGSDELIRVFIDEKIKPLIEPESND